MRAEPRARRRRVGLYGVSFIEESFFVEGLEQVPKGFDVAVVVGDVGVLHVDPVAHLLREVFPLLGVGHHVLAAGGVVFGHADLASDVLFGDA